MPVRRMKRGECPSDSGARNTPIHHWIFPDIRGVIERDELMPHHLRVNPKRHCRETEQDGNIGAPEDFTVAELRDISSVGCGRATSFSLLRFSFRHAVLRYYQKTDDRPSDQWPSLLANCSKHL